MVRWRAVRGVQVSAVALDSCGLPRHRPISSSMRAIVLLCVS
jgi:hypothetical protein